MLSNIIQINTICVLKSNAKSVQRRHLKNTHQVWIIIFKVAGDFTANIQVKYWINKK